MTPETITACENVCRDFWFLWRLDPRVIQGLLTLLAALVTSGVALHIARNIYPIQKAKDRELKIEEEKRQVFRDFFKNVDTFLNARLYKSQDKKLELALNAKAALNEVSIFASQATAEAMFELYSSASEYSNHLSTLSKSDSGSDLESRELSQKTVKAFRQAVDAARIELGETPTDGKLGISVLNHVEMVDN